MRRHWKYLKYVVRHKWFVLLACWKCGLYWRGIVHDMSKFRPSEWFPYARHFYNSDGTQVTVRDKSGYYKPTDTGDPAFDFAWLLHQKRNRHHWQWWVLPEDEGGVKVLSMQEPYLTEMLCDWEGAGMAQGTPGGRGWYDRNWHKMQLSPETSAIIAREMLGRYGKPEVIAT